MAKKKDEKDVLVVRDEKTGEISVVAGLNADGTPKRTPAKAENAQSFLQFDRHGDVLDNFFKNFFRQCKEPSRFGFYRIAADQAENLLEVMKQLLKDPEANKELLAPHKVDTSDYEKKVQEEMAAQQTEKQEPQKQENMEQRKEQQQDKSEQMQGKRGYQPIDESKINWQELEDRWGVKRDNLEKSGDLTKMLNYGKSDLQQRDGRGVRAGNEIAKHFAGNNVDVIIYAVEKSLDSYKFNLLHCKQTFISQLKSGAMGARTIDEGAMDEKSGMNFSEYMALLSGNTDLLDKAKLEKRIASLEGERKSFNKGKRDSEFKLESKTGELRNNTAFIDAMTEDWNRFLSVVQTDKEGNRLNIIKVDGVDSADEKVIGKRLQEIAKNATTGGLYTQVGELYGFPIKVVSERILKEGLEFTDNRFVVEGNYKYTYNNGHLAMADPLAAARNFLNAMERIPSIIDQYKAKNEVLEMEIPQLQEIAGKVWKKEDELKQLKSELAALDRKIQLELAPPTPEVAEKENEGQQLKPEAEDVRNRQAQYPENAPPQIRSPADSIVANHVIIGRPGLYAKEETRSKGLKI